MRRVTVTDDAVTVMVRVADLVSPAATTFASSFRTWLSNTNVHGLGSLVTLVDVEDNSLVDGCPKLRLSRALWNCMRPYRGWAEEVEGVLQPEGEGEYFQKDLNLGIPFRQGYLDLP